MASKTFSGQLDQAMNEAAAEGNKILFIPQQTVGEVLPGAASELVVESDGTYSIKLAYNTYSIYHYSDVTKRKTLLATDIVVSTDTAVTTIPDLLGSVVPVTEDSVLTIQGYLDEANEAKTDAETAQAETEALFDDFDSSVADSMALVHTDTPSLSIPFNESGRLDYGVGTEYVSGLPVYGVDFTRSTSCYYINKSGLVNYADVDEIAIGKDGVLLHGSVTNLCLSSGDVSDETYWDLNTNVTYGSTDSEMGIDLQYVIPSTTSGNHYLRQQSIAPSSQEITVTLFFKKNSDFSCRIYIREGTNSYRVTQNFTMDTLEVGEIQEVGDATIDLFELQSLGDYARATLQLTFPDGVDISNTQALIYILEREDYSTTAPDSYAGDGVTGTYIGGVEILDGHYDLDTYIPTTSASSTITATACNVPISGNLPSAGESFTIVFDAEFPDSTDTHIVFTANSDVSGGAILFRQYNGSIQWFHDRADGTDANLTASNDIYSVGRHRYSLTFDGSSFAMYCDEVLVKSRTPDDFCWFDLDGYLYFNSSYNNQLKNFKILPYAASADEVKSWGAPK